MTFIVGLYELHGISLNISHSDRDQLCICAEIVNNTLLQLVPQTTDNLKNVR